MVRADEKRVLLRNEVIITRKLERQSLRAQAAESAVSGLFLIQFTGPPNDLQRADLLARGVKLLRPVPEDAFVVELSETRLDHLQELEYVHWAGAYKPEHKSHPRIQALARLADDSLARVTAVLSPAATLRETAILQRSFRLLTRYGKSSAGRVLEGEILARNLRHLTQSKAVLWVEPSPDPKLADAVAVEIMGLGLPNLPAHLELGFDGEGVTVAVADSGLHLGEGEEMHPDLDGRVEGFFYYGALEDASDEHGHGTHVTGIIAGDAATGEADESGYLFGLGVAPGARVVAQRIFDGLGGYHAPPSYAKMTTDAVRSGAVIGSNSWGDETQGRYDTSAMEFDALVRDADPETPGDQPYILEFSAGNAGPGERTIYSPAVGKNVIATGASQNNRFDFFIYASGQESMADFSSRGPCEDGRIKPDVTAPGTWIASLQSGAATDENAWSPISPYYQYQGGTSQAGPHASGAAAVFVQYYRESHSGATPSPALVKAALINSATDMDNSLGPLDGGTSHIPNNDEGWGRVDLFELLGGDRSFDFTEQAQPLRTGEIFEKRLVLAGDGMPLKVTLAYTDVPGFPPAIPALVNDLDLEMVSPSGRVYRGNQFIDGESLPGAPGADSINNVEGIQLGSPERGEYVVRVIARRVLEDARRDTAAVDQDFALVFSGDVPAPGQGVISLDRAAYGVPGTMRLKLIDFDLAGQPGAAVRLSSSSELQPLEVLLRPSGSFGVFTGEVQTAALPVAVDDKVHIKHGDEIRVIYLDALPAQTVVVAARADLLPPVISGVSATNRYGKEIVSWQTDEPATGTVYYRPVGGAEFSVRSTLLAQTDPEILIEGLQAGQAYEYWIMAQDDAGNISTNDNSGAFHRFVARPASTVLLVDAYTFSGGEEDIEISVTEYTRALDRTGISYEVWDVETEGSPKLADLTPFRVVMWRINDSFWNVGNTLSAGDQGVITQYLAQGGSFFIGSMDLLTRIGPTAFRTNVLQVAEFKQSASPWEPCSECHEDQGATEIAASDFESLTAGMSMVLDYSQYPIFELEPTFPNIGPDLSDTFVPSTNAAPILVQEDGGVVGIKYPKPGQDGQGRVVFLSFALDTVPMEGPAPNNRASLLRSILYFLAPGLNGVGSISMDNTSYSVPANVTIEVADSDLIGQRFVTIECRAQGTQARTIAELRPTVRPGVFRGNLTLAPTNAPALQGRLPIGNGDVLIAEYNDLSASTKLQALAGIDMGLPSIENLELVADYEGAVVSWETDEFTDALIQFGESAFLGKTAYHPGPNVSHEVTLFPLVPDRLYYYQVVSRDLAGNTVVDNNGGKLYTFRTLKPLAPPWSDDLEGGASDWSVQDGDETVGSWRLGRPNNDLATESHSPANAWGVNLDGEPTDYVSTFLISPAIELKGGNLATLRFWHNYDFTGNATFELGRLLLFTNTQTQPITLANYEEFTSGWEEEEFDLSQHAGKVVHIVWAYEMIDISFEGRVHPGWMVDDAEVTITNVALGTIRVTNNISEAAFAVTGPTPFEGAGRAMIRSNALAGTYVIRYLPSPYYTEPPPQTNTLAAGTLLVFEGRYTFADANVNGISDAWEQEKFGEISPTRTRETDSDQDGATDWAEFTAGTDPADAGSKLEMASVEIMSNSRVRVRWPSITGKTYRLLGSRDGVSWEAYSAPIRCTSSSTSFVLPSPKGAVWFFKLELLP